MKEKKEKNNFYSKPRNKLWKTQVTSCVVYSIEKNKKAFCKVCKKIYIFFHGAPQRDVKGEKHFDCLECE